MTPIEQVRKRADGHCEAMVAIEDQGYVTAWARCGKGPVEVHHALTKARGGRILDEVGETYHLIALCPRCHRLADGEAAYAGAVLIDGYVNRAGDLWPVYEGSDEYLSEKYPRRSA